MTKTFKILTFDRQPSISQLNIPVRPCLWHMPGVKLFEQNSTDSKHLATNQNSLAEILYNKSQKTQDK